MEPDDQSMATRMLIVPLALAEGNYWDNSVKSNKGKGKGANKNNKRTAKAKLREKNKKEHTSAIKVHGTIDYLSGLCCRTVGFGVFDKKWFVETSTHEVSSAAFH
jgi:hypothetical protein